MNRKIEEMIRALANYNKDNWDVYLVDFEVAYNSAVNSTTLCTLFYVNYGMHPRTVPIEAWNTNNQAVEESVKKLNILRNLFVK